MSASSWPASGKARHLYPLCLITLCVLFLLAGGCSPERYLRTAAADPQKITGEFSVILYGARYAADMQNVALLDKEDDRYTFAVFAPHFDYKVMTGLSADGAIAEAERHTRSHHASRQTEWRSIQDLEGTTIGFEARPLYAPLDSGYPDILDISYTVDGNVVTAHIRFKPEIEKAVREEEAPSLLRMRR